MKLGWFSGNIPLASGITATAQPAASASFTTASLASPMRVCWIDGERVGLVSFDSVCSNVTYSKIRTLTPMTMTGLAAAFHISSVVSRAMRIEAELEGLRGGSWKGTGSEMGSSAMLQAISMYTGFLSVSAVTMAWSICRAACAGERTSTTSATTCCDSVV